MPAAGSVTHPDLSPDGTKLVYVRHGVAGSDWTFGSGQIYMAHVRSGERHVRPRARARRRRRATTTTRRGRPTASGSCSTSAPTTRRRRVQQRRTRRCGSIKADGSAPGDRARPPLNVGRWPHELVGRAGRRSQQTLGTSNEPMFWVTVSSKRDFGVRLVGAEPPADLDDAVLPRSGGRSSTDPSGAPFRLPFQDIDEQQPHRAVDREGHRDAVGS